MASDQAPARPRDPQQFRMLTRAVVITFLLGVIDCVTGYELGFFVFYYIPVALASWYGSRNAGMIVSILSAAVWFTSDLLSAHPYSSQAFGFWNTAIRLAAFLTVAVTVARCRELLEEQRRLASELKSALAEVKQLKGYLPICAWCKQVRNDDGYWEQIEDYVASRTDADFTHGICPECARKVRKT